MSSELYIFCKVCISMPSRANASDNADKFDTARTCQLR